MVRHITIVTGASRGLGLSLASTLSQEGLVLALARSPKPIQFENNPNIIYERADLKNKGDIEKIINILGVKYKVKRLINNAALIKAQKNISENSFEDIEEALKLNVLTPLYLSSFLIKNRAFVDRARILNIGSKCGHIHFPGYSTYCVTKAALYMSNLAMKHDFKEKGVFTSSLMPGVMETDMMEEVISANSFQFDRKKFLKTDTVAKFVKYLLSNKISDQEFEKKEWDIYDLNHHEFWKEKEDYVPLEAPKPIKL